MSYGHVLAGCLATFAVACGSVPTAQAAYRLVDLGPSSLGFRPQAINDAQTIVGSAGGQAAPQVWRNGQLEPLPQGGAQGCSVADINVSGKAVGACFAGHSFAATWSIPASGPIGPPTALGTLGGTYRAEFALGVAGDGTAVGLALERDPNAPGGSGAPPVDRAVTWTPDGNIRRLDGSSFTAIDYGAAYGVNASGTAVGRRTGSPTSGRSWSSIDKSIIDRLDQAPTALGIAGCTSHAINASGTVVGLQEPGNRGTLRALGGPLVDLGFFRPNAINDAGVVVGAVLSGFQTGAPSSAAIRSTDGTVNDLQSLLDTPSAMVLDGACDINERGDIIGFGRAGGVPHGFLLVNLGGTVPPTPPPFVAPVAPPLTAAGPLPLIALPPNPDARARVFAISSTVRDRKPSVTVVRGGVTYRLETTSSLGPGDVIRTDEHTMLVLEFAIGGRVGLNTGSAIEITGDRTTADRTTDRVTVNKGSVWTRPNPLPSVLEIQTNGGVMGIRG